MNYQMNNEQSRMFIKSVESIRVANNSLVRIASDNMHAVQVCNCNLCVGIKSLHCALAELTKTTNG